MLRIRLAQQRVLLAAALAILSAVTSLLIAPSASAAQPEPRHPNSGTVNYLVMEERAQPFQIVESGVSKGGIVTDIVSAIFAGSPWTVNPITMPVKRLQQAVLNGDVSHWIAYDALRWRSFGNRGLMIDEPLFDTQHTLLTCRQDLPDHINSVDQLQGLKLATIRGFSYPEIEQAARKGLVQQVPVDRYNAGLSLVSMMRVDGFVEMTTRLRYHMKNAVNKGCFRWVDMSDVIPDFPIYLSVSVEWPSDFRSFIADRIRQLKAAGRFKAIRDRYAKSAVSRAAHYWGDSVLPGQERLINTDYDQ